MAIKRDWGRKREGRRVLWSVGDNYNVRKRETERGERSTCTWLIGRRRGLSRYGKRKVKEKLQIFQSTLELNNYELISMRALGTYQVIFKSLRSPSQLFAFDLLTHTSGGESLKGKKTDSKITEFGWGGSGSFCKLENMKLCNSGDWKKKEKPGQVKIRPGFQNIWALPTSIKRLADRR